MKRLYEPAAYGPRVGCWWDETVAPPVVDRLESDAQADVVILGAGYTGLSAALSLAEAGLEVVVLDAEHPGFGASGRNGGFCCLGGGMLSFAAFKRRYGEADMRAWAQAQRSAIDLVAARLDTWGLDVDRHSEGETILAHSKRAMRSFADEAETVANLFGVVPSVLQRGDLAEAGMGGRFYGAMTTPIGFALNPMKYSLGLLAAVRKAKARVFGRSPCHALQPEGSGWRAITPKGSVRAPRVLIATNGYSAEDVPAWLRARTLPVQSSILVTRPLTRDEQLAQGWITDQMAYDSRFLLHYFRKLPDNRFLFGMRGGLFATPAAQRRVSRRIRSDFQRLFPAWRDVAITHDWSGLVCLMANAVPFTGPVPYHPGLFAALGYHGNGVAMGSLAGTIVADHIVGRPHVHPWPQSLSQVPAKFPLGRFRRALLAPVYAASTVMDH